MKPHEESIRFVRTLPAHRAWRLAETVYAMNLASANKSGKTCFSIRGTIRGLRSGDRLRLRIHNLGIASRRDS